MFLTALMWIVNVESELYSISQLHTARVSVLNDVYFIVNYFVVLCASCSVVTGLIA